MSDYLKSLLRVAAPVGVAALLSALAPAVASAHGRAGLLECKLSGDNAAILVEERAVDCIYEDDSGAPPVHYVGNVTNVGAVFGVGGPGELAWGVVAASGAAGPGALAGDYVGAHGSFALGVGGGGSVLVGGSNDTVTLQPVSVEANTGVILSAGVGHLSLRYAPEPAGRHHGRFHRHHHHHHHYHHHHHRHHRHHHHH
jgi:hypothetical protein